MTWWMLIGAAVLIYLWQKQDRQDVEDNRRIARKLDEVLRKHR